MLHFWSKFHPLLALLSTSNQPDNYLPLLNQQLGSVQALHYYISAFLKNLNPPIPPSSAKSARV